MFGTMTQNSSNLEDNGKLVKRHADEGRTSSRILLRKHFPNNPFITSSVINEVKDTFQQMDKKITKFCESQQRKVAADLNNIVQAIITSSTAKSEESDTKTENKIKSLSKTIVKQIT